MQNEEPDEGGVPAENVVATLNHPGYLESQSKSICERRHEATPQRDVTFPARSVAVAYWKSGDDDGAGTHVHKHAVHGKKPAHWLHPKATILEANYNTAEAQTNRNNIDWVYGPVRLGKIIKAEIRQRWQGFRHALVCVSVDPVHEQNGNDKVY